MAKTRILIEFPGDRLDRVFYEVRAGIDKVTQQCGWDDSKLRIAMPKYFYEMLERNLLRHVSETPLLLSEQKRTFFGIDIVPNYDNFIVIFHEDMPMFLENFYVVVDLR